MHWVEERNVHNNAICIKGTADMKSKQERRRRRRQVEMGDESEKK